MAQLLPSNLFSKPIYHFYVAAHFENFTQASRYLHVGQSAVSHAVKELEQQLNIKLFYRQHRNVALTDKGLLLFESLKIGKIPIEQVMQKIKNVERDQNRVTLSLSTATAINLILPNIADFQQRYPNIEIKFITNDFDIDFIQDSIDLAIPLETGPWKGYNTWPFADEVVYAVCSPDYAKKWVKHPESLSSYDISLLNLIHTDEKRKTRLDWQDWFHYFDKSTQVNKDGLSFTDYSIVLQMAINGQGVALGWEHLIKPLVKDNKLMILGDCKMVTNNPFIILETSQDTKKSSVKQLREWLMQL